MRLVLWRGSSTVDCATAVAPTYGMCVPTNLKKVCYLIPNYKRRTCHDTAANVNLKCTFNRSLRRGLVTRHDEAFPIKQ